MPFPLTSTIKSGLTFAAARLVIFAPFALMQYFSPESAFLIFVDVPAVLLLWGCSALFGVPQGIKDLLDPWFFASALVTWFCIGCAVGILRNRMTQRAT